MRGPFGCTICFPGAPSHQPALPPEATDRQRIAALCNHVMQVHNGGPVDAWQEALLVYPVAAREWEQETRATGSYRERCVASLHIPTTGATCSVCGAVGMQHEDDHPGGGARA